jgi:site-specific DNA-methyltransferase (adenine-specific)
LEKNKNIMEFPKDFINQIVCGDCLEVMKYIPDNSIDLVVTSPPYNIGIQYDTWNDRMPWDEYYDWCRKWMREIYRILKPDGRFCLNHYFSLGSGKRGAEIGMRKNNLQIEDLEATRQTPLMDLNWIAVKEIGFKHHAVVFWLDLSVSRETAWGSWLSASAPYINSCLEGILILFKKYWKKQREGISTIEKELFVKASRGVWELGTVSNSLTPAVFPEKLPEYCIKLFSYVDDIVLDPFCGSGTTCVVAKKLKRKFIGIEISENYCKIARERLRQQFLF